MRGFLVVSALFAAVMASNSASHAAAPDLSGVWSPPFEIHSSGLPLMAGATVWMAQSEGDPATVAAPTLRQLSAIADESVRTHHGVPIYGAPQPKTPPFTPAGQAAFAAIDPKVVTEKELACYPVNVLSRIGAGPVQIVQGKSAVSFLNEGGLGRTVFLDARSEADALPQWSGHSVGHWDGDVFKVTTTAIRGGIFDFQPVWPLSDTAVVEEEYRLSPDGQHLMLRETLRDRAFYKEPLRRMVYMNRVNEEVTDYTCTEGKDDMIETVMKPKPID